MFVVGIVGSIVVVALMVGVILVQTGSNVNEVSISSSSTSLASESSTQSDSTTSSGTTIESSVTASTSTYTGPTGILGVSLTDPPIVPPGVTNVYISYSSIQVHVADAGNHDWWYLVAESGSVDLMSLVNVSLTLGSAAVQTGVFNLISFNITSAAVTINGQNATAYVPANRINVPIVGGISVSSDNSSGVLVDLSPEVVPYQNGTSVSYVLVPEARSLPIPRDVWNYKLEVKGAKLDEIQNQTWVSAAAGQVVVTGVHLTSNSFSLTLQNQGTTNSSFSSIVLGQVLPLPQCLATSTTDSPRPADENGSYVSVSVEGASFVGAQSVFIGGRVYPSPSITNATAAVLVTDPNGVVVESLNSSVEVSGAFHVTFTAGGSGLPWVGGLYTVSATYNGTTGRASFNWTPAVQTTTTTHDYTITTTSFSEFSYTTTTTSEYPNSTLAHPNNLTVLTNGTSYYGQTGVLVYGGVSPAPVSSDYWVSLRVLNPNRVVVFSTEAQVSSNGQFNASFGLGTASGDNAGKYLWTNGTYLVYAYHEGVVSATKFQWSGPSPVVTSYTETTTYQTSTTNGGFQKYFCGLYSSQSRLPPSFPVAYYAIFANGTLYPVNYTSLMLHRISYLSSEHRDGNGSTSSLISETPLTYTLAPGQSVTFTFNGAIDTLTGALLSYLPANFAVPSSLFHINLGQEYTVSASGPFETRIATLVNATAS